MSISKNSLGEIERDLRSIQLHLNQLILDAAEDARKGAIQTITISSRVQRIRSILDDLLK